MPRGAPDYANVRVEAPVHGLKDLAEHAARMGSIVTHDRAGDVLIADDFNRGVTEWTALVGGFGRDFRSTAKHSRMPAFSMEIIPATGDDFYHIVSRKFVYPPATKIGTEIAFTVPAKTDYIRLELLVYDGTNAYLSGIEYDHTNTQVEYYGSGGSYSVLDSNVKLSTGDTLFHVLKFVTDIENETYYRAILDSRGWKGLDYAVWKQVNAVAPYVEVRLRVTPTDGTQPSFYADCFILTQNEP